MFRGFWVGEDDGDNEDVGDNGDDGDDGGEKWGEVGWGFRWFMLGLLLLFGFSCLL